MLWCATHLTVLAMDNFVVVINIAEETVEQLDYCLGSLRAVYPTVPVHIISDGINDPAHQAVATRYRTDYTAGKFLKRIECGGRWWQRTLGIGMRYLKAWVIKMDPDTRVWRQFHHMPTTPVGGSLGAIGQMTEHLQGGCQAIRSDAVAELLSSNVLNDEDLTRFTTFCPDNEMLKTWLPTGYLTSDFSLMYLLKKLSIEYSNWDEIGARWKVAPSNFNYRFAVTHPHKVDEQHGPGVGAGVPLHVIMTCMGRRHHVERSLPLLLAERNVKVTLVDYSCPQGVGDWVRHEFPQCRVVSVPGKRTFNLSDARNQGAADTPPGWWCFIDSDILVKPGWANAVRGVLRPHHYYIAHPLIWGMTGSVVLHSDDFRSAGGYDDVIYGWGSDDIAFYINLRQNNVRPDFWPGTFASPIKHGDADRVKNYDIPKATSNAISSEYYRRKAHWIVSKWALPDRKIRLALMREAEAYVDTLGVANVPAVYHSGPAPQLDTRATEKPMGDHEAPTRPTSQSPERGPILGGTQKLWANPESVSIATGGATAGLLMSPRSRNLTTISVVNHATVDLGLSLQNLIEVGHHFLNDILTVCWPGTEAVLIATTRILPRTQAIIIMDDSAQDDSALGYQNLTPDGLPLHKLYIRNSLRRGSPATVEFTSGLAELRTDPSINMTAVDNDGVIYGLECASPVLGVTARSGGWPVANIVTPDWFQPYHNSRSQPRLGQGNNVPTKFDYAGLLTQPFQLAATGYALVVK